MVTTCGTVCEAAVMNTDDLQRRSAVNGHAAGYLQMNLVLTAEKEGTLRLACQCRRKLEAKRASREEKKLETTSFVLQVSFGTPAGQRGLGKICTRKESAVG